MLACSKRDLLLSALVLPLQGTVSYRELLTGLVESTGRRYKGGNSALFHHHHYPVVETGVLNMVGENRPRPLVVFGPSAVGKGTIIKTIVNKFPNTFVLTVSYTTRKPREGEKDGKHYYFISREEFKQRIENGEFMEYAEVHKNLYGTTFKALQDVMKTGKVCILDVDSQGVKSIKALKTKLGNPYYMCVVPPCVNALRERIRHRGSESPEQLEMRLAAAMGEINFCHEIGQCDAKVVRLFYLLMMSFSPLFSSLLFSIQERESERERESYTMLYPSITYYTVTL